MIDTTENIAPVQNKENNRKMEDIPAYDLILQRIRLRARRRIAWLRKIWTEAGADNNENGSFNLHSEIDGCLGNMDTIVQEANWFASEKNLQPVNHELEQTEKILGRDTASRFAQLIKIFGLNDIEANIIQACLALAADPNLGRVYAYLHDHSGRTYVTQQMVGRLFGHGQFLSIGPSSPLIAWALIVETDMGRSEPSRIDCDPFIMNWLMGLNDPDPALAGISRIQPFHLPLTHWKVKEIVEMIKKKIIKQRGEVIRLFIAGPEGSGKRTLAAAISLQLGLPLLSVQSSGVNSSSWPLLYMRAQRQSRLGGCLLLWEGNSAFENRWPVHIASSQLQFVTGQTDEVVLNGENIIDIRLEVPAIPVDEAFRLWQKFVPLSRNWPKEELMQMIRKQQGNIGQLVAVSKIEINNVSEASEALRNTSRQRLGDLAQQLDSSFSMDDLVVPSALQASLDDFCYEASERSAVWERAEVKKMFPQGRGLLALFTGVPGTGKTMAAQVIANTLQLDLFRIDLSTIVSKYIGETSKNIERILSRASRMNVVLLFDEADSLFGKRTEIKDAHDRFANTDTNYLLQAIEEYPGVAILASNRKANIDASFTRRLRYILEFPKPDTQQRLQLWQKLIVDLTGKENAIALNNDLPRLAEILEVTGAQIKLSILSAIFMAKREGGSITITHLLKGMERELAKEGRGIGRQAHEMMKEKQIIIK